MDQTMYLAEYLQALFVSEFLGQGDGLKMPNNVPLELLEESHFVVRLIIRAIHNRRQTRWSVFDYIRDMQKHGYTSAQEERRARIFAPCSNGELLTEPCVVTDINGAILLWYLPGLISLKRQRYIWSFLTTIEGRLAIKYGASSWRINEVFFRSDPAFCYRPGTVSYSLAWFQQGMTTKKSIEVSAELRTPDRPAHAWLKMMQDTTRLLGATVAVINPNVFEAGISVMQELRLHPNRVAKNENLAALMESWASPYTSGSLMSNRDSPLHRDRSGDFATMDLLLSVGHYSQGRFHVPGLGFDLQYMSGTVIGIAGRVLMHGATSSGERLCYAQWNKQNVLDFLNIPSTKWTYLDTLVAQCQKP